jgi:hypothetical protein
LKYRIDRLLGDCQPMFLDDCDRLLPRSFVEIGTRLDENQEKEE